MPYVPPDAHEFRINVTRSDGDQTVLVAIYNCSGGVESGDVLSFPNKASALSAVDELRDNIEKHGG